MKESEFSKLIYDIYTWRIRDTLDCQNKGIDDQQALHIAQALKENPFIRSVHLSGNRISDAGATLLLERAYHHDSKINSVHLARNNIRKFTTLSRFQNQQKSLKLNITSNPVSNENLNSLPKNFLNTLIVNEPNNIPSPAPKTRQAKKIPKITVASHPVNLEFARKLADPLLKINQVVEEIITHPQWSNINTKNLTQVFCKLAARFIASQDQAKPFFKDLSSNDKLRKLSNDCLSKYSEEMNPLLKDTVQIKLSLQVQRLSQDLKNKELTDIFCALALFNTPDLPLIQSLWKQVENLAKKGSLTHHHWVRILWALSKLDSKLEIPSPVKQKMSLLLAGWIDLKRPCFMLKHLFKAAEALLNMNLSAHNLLQSLQGLLDEVLLRMHQESLKGELKLRQLLSCKEISTLEKMLNIVKASSDKEKILTIGQEHPSKPDLFIAHKDLISQLEQEIHFRKMNMPIKMKAKSEYYNLKQTNVLLGIIKKKLTTTTTALSSITMKTSQDSLASSQYKAQHATFAYSTVAMAKEPSSASSPAAPAFATTPAFFATTSTTATVSTALNNSNSNVASTHFISPKSTN